ncbi:hypothetical protein NDU88_003788 [Pleurodeles waltl]|uniref:Uncharacterized protein n=1 Tax=Pleurodeles waltl TaxID=8319 RepID=A0AAV7RHM2_PLEWA|nr:hypothetical protein NDU88_003788 [Pleurodeles waltl]
MTPRITSARSGPTEECPRGTFQSVALLRCFEKNPEGKTQRAVIKKSRSERERVAGRSNEEIYTTGWNTITAKNSSGKDAVSTRETPEESSAAKDADSEEEEVKEGSERRERENSTTCHVPGGRV